jgi:tRNA(Ile)-lysidine synthase
MGPHPALAQVRTAVRQALAGARPHVLVACSGGADSLALAAAAAFVAPRTGRRAGLVTVDHGLQPGSAEQARRVATLGYELGLDPVEILPVGVGREGGLEAAARAARYAALEELAGVLDASILLGHTLDDQAETVLLGLGRGSGPRAIAGMRPAHGVYLRPLLGLRRETTVAACAALGLPVWEDPHNQDPAFQRVRLRREVLPLLEQVLQGGVAAALARTASLLRDDLDALDEIARQMLDQGRVVAADRPELDLDQGRDGQEAPAGAAPALDAAALADLPRAVRSRVLRTWAGRCGAASLTAVHIRALDELLTSWRGQGPIDLPGGLRVYRRSGKLVAHRAPSTRPG